MRVLLRLAAVLVLLPGAAQAAEPLREQRGFASFSVAAAAPLALEKLTVNDAALAAFAPVLPPEAREFELVGFRAPGFAFRLGAARRQLPRGTPEDIVPELAVQLDGRQPVVLPLDPGAATGALTHVQAFSPGDPATAGVVLVLAFATRGDVPLAAVYVDPHGSVAAVDLGGARTLRGSFELADLDGNGSYELITQRHLDGWEEGFTYKAVRAFDPERLSFGPNPDAYRDFFSGELEFYDWVLATRDLIEAEPERYLSRQPRRAVFAADRQGRSYGFDSLVPLEEDELAGGNVAEHNREVAAALRRVQSYRDELAAWLNGQGGYPSVWRMGR